VPLQNLQCKPYLLYVKCNPVSKKKAGSSSNKSLVTLQKKATSLSRRRVAWPQTQNNTPRGPTADDTSQAVGRLAR